MDDSDTSMGIGWCLGCYYDLRGLTSRRCPECGRPFTPGRRETYSPTPKPERLRKLVEAAMEFVTPAEDDAARRARLMALRQASALGEVHELRAEVAGLRTLVDHLGRLLVDKAVLSPEEWAALRAQAETRRAEVRDPLTVVDDDVPEEAEAEGAPSRELEELGRAVEQVEGKRAESRDG
jgi:hypothetical protein